MNTDTIGGWTIITVSLLVLLATLLGVWAGNRNGGR